jgi:hypothetical protein
MSTAAEVIFCALEKHLWFTAHFFAVVSRRLAQQCQIILFLVQFFFEGFAIFCRRWQPRNVSVICFSRGAMTENLQWNLVNYVSIMMSDAVGIV